MTRAIIVDDEKLLRQGFIHMTDWARHGFEIVGEAGNGQEALELVERERPDIVVTDIRMPVMDGIQLTLALKERHPEVQVIVLSSYNDFDYVKETMQLGAVDYILKPKMQYTDLLAAMEKAKARRGSVKVPQEAQPSRDFYGDLWSGQPGGVPPLDTFELSIKELQQLIDKRDIGGIADRLIEHSDEALAAGMDIEPYALKKGFIEACYYVIHKLNENGVDTEELHHRKNAYFKRLEDSPDYGACCRELRRILAEIVDFQPTPGYAGYSPTIRAVVDYLHEHYGEAISLSTTARHFHLNKSYLSQSFKQQTGDNFNVYLTGLRIEKARQLLKQPEASVHAVCQAVGFENQSYFGQVFKRMVGTTPSEYSRTVSGK